MATIAHIVEMLASLNAAILFGLIVGWLVACVSGTLVYDSQPIIFGLVGHRIIKAWSTKAPSKKRHQTNNAIHTLLPATVDYR
jgi:Na+/citrate or Na+/malate symporter